MSPRCSMLTAVTSAKAQRGIGSVYGTSRNRPFDRWFRYPAGFSPDALQLAADATGIGPGAVVVDPFFGSGATAVGLPGVSVVGIEAHPLISDLAAAKL